MKSPRSEFPTRLAETDMPDAAFPSRKAACPETRSTQNIGNSHHEYRITVDVLHPGGEGTESVSFFASTETDLFLECERLRLQGCSAARALRLALGASLLNEMTAVESALVSVTATET